MCARNRRGFTLIEVMVSAAIIGILSSVAIPSYLDMTLRTRKAEREMVLTSIRRSVSVILVRDREFKDALNSDWNPDANPGTGPRPFRLDQAIGDGGLTWNNLDVEMEGRVYLSYMFQAMDTTFTVWARSDLDGNDQNQDKIERYSVVDGGLSLVPSTPEAPNPQFIPDGDLQF
jgi:prepilin-type N-terminal cleavage/methylation domain-containing protein